MPDDPFLVALEGVETEEVLQFGLENGGVDGHSLGFYGTKYNEIRRKNQMLSVRRTKKCAEKAAKSLRFVEETNNLLLFEEKAVSLQDSGFKQAAPEKETC